MGADIQCNYTNAIKQEILLFQHWFYITMLPLILKKTFYSINRTIPVWYYRIVDGCCYKWCIYTIVNISYVDRRQDMHTV